MFESFRWLKGATDHISYKTLKSSSRMKRSVGWWFQHVAATDEETGDAQTSEWRHSVRQASVVRLSRDHTSLPTVANDASAATPSRRTRLRYRGNEDVAVMRWRQWRADCCSSAADDDWTTIHRQRPVMTMTDSRRHTHWKTFWTTLHCCLPRPAEHCIYKHNSHRWLAMRQHFSFFLLAL